MNSVTCFCSLTVERIEPQGVPPTIRAYHSFSILGNRCYVIGGRTSNETLIVGDEIVRVYDVATHQWTADIASGSFSTRSNHKAVEVSRDQLVITGGTGKLKSKMADTQIQKVPQNLKMIFKINALTPFETGRLLSRASTGYPFAANSQMPFKHAAAQFFHN